jgi:uncharacterized protein (DUF39 family)
MGYAATVNEFGLACPLLNQQVAEQAARRTRETKNQVFDPRRPSVLDTQAQNSSVTVAQDLEIQARKESSKHESRFFSHCTGS